MIRKNGFTLVEVIIVAVIISILSASAIPIYQSYIADASESRCKSVAASLTQAIQAAAASGFSMNPVNWNSVMVSPHLLWPEGGDQHPELIIPPEMVITVVSGNGHEFIGEAIVSYRGKSAIARW